VLWANDREAYASVPPTPPVVHLSRRVSGDHLIDPRQRPARVTRSSTWSSKTDIGVVDYFFFFFFLVVFFAFVFRFFAIAALLA
jgi:hypothetical protein